MNVIVDPLMRLDVVLLRGVGPENLLLGHLGHLVSLVLGDGQSLAYHAGRDFWDVLVNSAPLALNAVAVVGCCGSADTGNAHTGAAAVGTVHEIGSGG